MTREEAIWRLENCLECTDCFTCGSHDTALVMAVAALREQEKWSKGCHNCYGNDMAIDAVDNPCWNCKGDHSEWRDGDEPSQIEKLAARYERNMHKPWKKPTTNADRIRAMSDEELAEFLRWDICVKIRGDNRLCNGWCDECVVEWLQQPVKEDA